MVGGRIRRDKNCKLNPCIKQGTFIFPAYFTNLYFLPFSKSYATNPIEWRVYVVGCTYRFGGFENFPAFILGLVAISAHLDIN